MSGYDKSGEHYVYDFAATRPESEQSYAGFAQPSFTAQYPNTQVPESHGLPLAGQMPFLSASTYDPRDILYQPQSAPFIHARPRHLSPEITLQSYSPSRGVHGAKLYIHIRANYDLTTQHRVVCTVMFGSRRVGATLTKYPTEPKAPYFQYAIATDIPAFDETGWGDSQMPLLLNMEDEAGQSLGVVEVGDFTYADVVAYQQSQPQDVSRKRKISAESVEYVRSPSKRVSSQQLRTRDVPSVYQGTQSAMASASPYLQGTSPGMYSTQGYERFQQHEHSYSHRGSQRPTYQYATTASTSQAMAKARSPSAPSFGLYSTPGQLSSSPGSSVPAVSRPQMMPSPARLANPPLVRTSILQPSPPATTTAAGTSQAFNPYAMYPNSKAVLRIEGDLDSMSEDWTPEEWEAKRRLVQFRRSQSGSTIKTSFQAVSPEERTPNSICISCIWWEEKQECFVTSVDTIYLLESLVAVRFTVEEKNRIRRNLEGFRPLTVSKAKTESEEFFKIIMGFPNPKPRNIEKDVKVFPWKILSHALKKIIGKYSASYSSTAGALLTTVTSGYGSGGLSEASIEQAPIASPRSATSSAPSITYRGSMTSTALSPDIQASSAGPPDLRVSVPQLGATGQGYSHPWQAHPQQQSSLYSAGLSGTGRGSWDLAAYIDASPATATPVTAQTYQRVGGVPEQDEAPETKAYQQPYGQRTSSG